MSLKVLIIVCLFFYSFAYANDINISTVTKNGSTLFYLQAGAFALEKQAIKRQQQLAPLVKQAVEIKNLADKSLFLVQIGPIKDYPAARALKDKLSKNGSLPVRKEPLSSVSSLNPIQMTAPDINPSLPPDCHLWNLRNADIRAVISEVSRVTGKNFVVDPRVQGKVSIISSTPMSNHELYQVFLSALQVNGYAAVPSGEVIKIVPVIDAKSLAPGLINELREPPRGDDMMVSVIPVHYVPAEQLVPVLRPLMPQWSNVSAYGPSNMIILAGRANNIRRLTCIIKQVDSSTTSGIDVVRLHHALAMDVAVTLKDLIKVQPIQGGVRESITIASDDKTNSILISGNKTDRIRIRMLLLKLDKSNSQSGNCNTQVVYLHYLRAEDLTPILAGIAQANFSGVVGTTIGTITRPILDSTNPASNLTYPSTTPSSGASTAIAVPITPAPPGHTDATANTSTVSTQNEGSTKPSIQIIAEPNTNSIILNAPAAIIRILKSVICKLDIKPAQLLIEALVAEVNQEDVEELGIEWGSIQQTGNPTNFRPGFAIMNARTNFRDLQAQIYALASERKANILSTPSVVVLDNRQAKILVGKQVSVAATSYPNNGNGTAIASPYTTFDRVNVALHLYVRPQITQGNGIQMQIDQGNDTLDPSNVLNSNSTVPIFSISSIVTSVNVESGDIIVLGGLTQDGLGHNDVDVPILAGIPGLGRLFQHNIRNRQKKVLMVFIKPIILKDERDTVFFSGDKYMTTREHQLDWIRSQDIYDDSDAETVLPPLTVAELPKPFCGPLHSNQVSK